MTPKSEIELLGGMSVTVLGEVDEVVAILRNHGVLRGLVKCTTTMRTDIYIAVDKVLTVEAG